MKKVIFPIGLVIVMLFACKQLTPLEILIDETTQIEVFLPNEDGNWVNFKTIDDKKEIKKFKTFFTDEITEPSPSGNTGKLFFKTSSNLVEMNYNISTKFPNITYTLEGSPKTVKLTSDGIDFLKQFSWN